MAKTLETQLTERLADANAIAISLISLKANSNLKSDTDINNAIRKLDEVSFYIEETIRHDIHKGA